MRHTKTFEISYTDPETGEEKVVVKTFDGDDKFPAAYWADDYGYTVADKGPYAIKELK